RRYRAGYRSLSYTAFDNYITKIQFRGLVSEEEPQKFYSAVCTYAESRWSTHIYSEHTSALPFDL
ncbi:hypothetical protein ALC62_07008, partial [Cyphomyrmex costatus]